MTIPNEHSAIIIGQVRQYIYDHSDSVIHLDKLAEFTGYSKYHFNRLFFAATGYPLGEFIQRHKLEKALYLSQQGKHSTLDVALSVGYDSPSSFTRAFKKCFSITPTAISQGKSPSNPRVLGSPPNKSAELPPLKPELITLPEQTILGLYGKGFDEQSFSSVAADLYRQLSTMAEPTSFEKLQPIGVSIDNPWVKDQHESQFFAGFLNGLSASQSSLHSYQWQAGKWASFVHLGPHNTMWQTICQVYAQWVLPNNIKLKDQHIVQRYDNNPQTTPSKELKTTLFFAYE